MRIGNNMFYLIVLVIMLVGLCYSCMSFFNELRHNKTTSYCLNFIKRLTIDLFVIAFCLSKLLPEISWL